MRLNSKKLIPYLIVVVPLILVLSVSFFMTTFYLNKVTNYFDSAKSNAIKEYIDSKKQESELWSNQLVLLFEYTNNRLQPAVKKELKAEVDLAYRVAHRIYTKHKKRKSKKEIKQRIKDALNDLVYSDKNALIFIKDFNDNTILNASVPSKDASFRTLGLEEIQKVRRYSQGYLESEMLHSKDKKIIFVKNLHIYDWYIGTSVVLSSKQKELEDKLLNMIKSIPIDKSEFMGVYKEQTKLFLSKELEIDTSSFTDKTSWHKYELENHYYFSEYYKAFDWHIVYGFDINSMSKKEQIKQKELKEMLSYEFDFIIKVSAFIVVLTMLLSLLLSLKVNKIFKKYQEEVESRTEELEELNNSLEAKINAALKEQREKDKMLIQQSKMAEMGDMLSMIAHQWRQPLNQMSYVFMNIESAHEYDELTTEYLEIKVKEGNELLEFMSVTIDDFRNFFRPDKGKEEVEIEELVQTVLSLIKKSLDVDGIEIELRLEETPKVEIYKNEFIQVMLNLIKNAKDALVERSIQNPKIVISTTLLENSVVLRVSDNGGGVSQEIQEKIYDPYFSTKDQKSGTGLGLYMSKMIVEEHLGGKLSVTNVDDGASFSVEIPIF